MPGKLKVRILAARDLPVMDRASDLADAFVEVKFGQETFKTEVCRKSLNPTWNSEWFKFEASDEELQDEPLHFRVMDYDTYSAHDAIGKVYIDLTPLLWKDGVTEISGWMPIYDTMHGMRGEINIVVKVDLFEDVSRFRQSSVGVQFFNSSRVPTCYNLIAVHGFVEELVVNDDPEYQWIDMIRTPRASNEARQRLFSKLSGELQRKIGIKVLEMDGNAVIGYWQCYDLEGESGIVVRGIGTVVSIQKSAPVASPLSTSPPKDMHKDSHSFEDQGDLGTSPVNKTPTPQPPSPTKCVSPFRYSSDSDLPAGGSPGTAGSSGSGGGISQKPTLTTKTAILPQSIDMLEYPFFTLTVFPPGFLIHVGGVVAARSVKLLDKIHNPDEPETRDAWWTEIRTEIRSHAAAMGCHAVVGYKETTSIYDEVILLSAMGTAAIVNMRAPLPPQPSSAGSGSAVLTVSLDRQEFQKEQQASGTPPTSEINLLDTTQTADSNSKCSIIHIPYNDSTLPFPVNLTKCQLCKKQKVPDVLFSTVEPPPELQYTGKCCCISARICRAKRKAQGENNASLISDALPFMEYELHRQIMNKLKLKGMNSLFGLRVQITIGEVLLVGTATATGTYMCALPSPAPLRLSGKSASGSADLMQSIQKKLQDVTARNKDVYDLHHTESMDPGPQDSPKTLSTSTEELVDASITASQKDTYVIEVDDVEDSATVAGLFEPHLPEGFYDCSTELVPGNLFPNKHLQMITMMKMQTVTEPIPKHFSPIFNDLVQAMCFKLRSMAPLCLCKLCFDVMLPEDDIIQVYLTASAVQVREVSTQQDSTPHKGTSAAGTRSSADAELMFTMEELTDPARELQKEQGPKHSTPNKGQKPVRLEKRIVLPPSQESMNWRPLVEITPLSTIPDGIIDRYLGNINIFCIRESTSVRECGGVSGFMHGCMSEVNAIIRSHVTALGGNALVAYTLIDCVLLDNPHKNQCQCLVNVCGDAVHVLYDGSGSSTDTPSPAHLSPRSAQPSPREVLTTAGDVRGVSPDRN
ncbi:C2 domain-containing protein 5-like [Amphiura filiformis]|uniref:C2 domain-containing protein 5-like n=1 Tax=Amphiura filiformis TaxID=82378 RepID=UPI003B217707